MNANPSPNSTSFAFTLSGGPSNISTPFSLTDGGTFNSGGLPIGGVGGGGGGLFVSTRPYTTSLSENVGT